MLEVCKALALEILKSVRKIVLLGIVTGSLGTALGADSDVQRLKFSGFEAGTMSLGFGGEFPGANAYMLRTNDVTRFGFNFTKGGYYVTIRLGKFCEGARAVEARCRLSCEANEFGMVIVIK